MANEAVSSLRSRMSQAYLPNLVTWHKGNETLEPDFSNGVGIVLAATARVASPTGFRYFDAEAELPSQ
jgi:hypothetical protein